MEDVIDMENELTSRLSTLQKKLDKNALNEVSKDVTKVQELIKANLQRSKVIQVKNICTSRWIALRSLKGLLGGL